MKKHIYLTALIILTGFAIARAGGPKFNSPNGDPQALATADYGGFYIATAAFSAAYTTATEPYKL